MKYSNETIAISKLASCLVQVGILNMDDLKEIHKILKEDHMTYGIQIIKRILIRHRRHTRSGHDEGAVWV